MGTPMRTNGAINASLQKRNIQKFGEKPIEKEMNSLFSSDELSAQA